MSDLSSLPASGSSTSSNNSVYVKNYRSEDLRMRHKYYAPGASRTGSNADLNSLARSTTNTSSGYNSSSDLNSSSSLILPSSSRRTSSLSYRFPSEFIGLKQFSFVSAAFGVSNGTSGGIGGNLASGFTIHGYKASSFIDIPTGTFAAAAAVTSTLRPLGIGGITTTSGRTYFPYHRTFSGGAKIRCNSADPEVERRAALLTLEYTRSRSLLSRRDGSSTERHCHRISSSRSPSYSGSRSASADRLPNVSRYGGSKGSSLSDHKSSSLIPHNYHHLSNEYNGISLPPRNGCVYRTPVTELARNVSAYDWERGEGRSEWTGGGRGCGSDSVYSSSQGVFSRQSSCVSTATDMSTSTLHGSNGNISIQPAPLDSMQKVYLKPNDHDILQSAEKYKDFSWRNSEKNEIKGYSGSKGGRRSRKGAYDHRTSSFVSTLTPEDEQTLARVSRLFID
jgi:hypothetical protein